MSTTRYPFQQSEEDAPLLLTPAALIILAKEYNDMLEKSEPNPIENAVVDMFNKYMMSNNLRMVINKDRYNIEKRSRYTRELLVFEKCDKEEHNQ